MTLADLGNLGDFIGGVLVVVSLFYLAFQIRQNTRALRAASYQEAVRSVNDWAGLFAQSPDLSELFLGGVARYETLDPAKRNRFHHLLAIHLRNYSTALRLVGEGFLPAGACRAYDTFVERFMRSPALRRWWESNEGYFDEAVRARVRTVLAGPSVPAPEVF
jgi:hypothetical protein